MAAILIIEDEPSMRKLMTTSLSNKGFTVIEAENGRVGLELFQQHRPVIAITDILMPEKDGLETIRDLRRIDPEVKILAVSGGGQSTRLNFLGAAKAFGADIVLAKPFRINELLDAVKSLLDDDGSVGSRSGGGSVGGGSVGG
jgi:DNA-binding response OmpR family regulator